MNTKSKIEMGSNKSFGLVFFVFFALIAFWSFRGDFNQIKLLPLILSILFLILGLLNSKVLTPLNKVWFKFGIFLGSIISPIVMGFVFFIIVTPISFLIKISGKDLLRNKTNKDAKTYWIERDNRKGSMKKQF